MANQIRETRQGFVLTQGTQNSTVDGRVYWETRADLVAALRARGLHVGKGGIVTKNPSKEPEDLPNPEDPLDPALKYETNTPANEPTENDVLKYATREQSAAAESAPDDKKK